jgi:AraC family transcriptional regulator
MDGVSGPCSNERRRKVSELEVRIVDMEPMRVASAHGFGEHPEDLAWQRMLAFAQAQGLDTESVRFFGFNNPNPSPGSPNYGYEQWMTVGPEVEAGGEIVI